jgi:uncharacterized membrane protein YsdA (DUF1294 family)
MKYKDVSENYDSQRLVSWETLVMLTLLLTAPIWAAVRLSAYLEGTILAGIWLAVSLITFGLYWRDKRKAETGGWRVKESTLHLAEAFGGWAAAFLAQRTLHHKRSKPSYQMVFWSIVWLYEYVALDYLLNWQLARGAFGLVRGLVS